MRRNHTLIHLSRIMERLNDLDLLCNRVINHFACCINEMADDAIEQIQKHLEKPEIRSCRISLVVDFAHMTKPDYWHKCKIFGKISEDKARALSSKLEVMANMLKALELKVKKVNPEYAEKMITRMMSLCQKNIKITDYDIWKAEHPNPTAEMLLNQEIKLTTNMLLAGALKYDEKPTEKEMKEVRVDKVLEGLEHGKELPPDFAEECAKLRRYSYWIGKYIFMIDYRKIYRYLFMHCFDKLTKQQRLALFEYDVQMKQIHEDLAKMMPEIDKELKQSQSNDRELNMFAPMKSLKGMLKMEEMEDVIKDKKYNRQWFDQFVDELMSTDHGKLIAVEWESTDRRLKLKASILGALMASDVIGDSYLNIARTLMGGDDKEVKTFAKYMGNWQRWSFAEWIQNYAK